jgi:simple sugar transport system permease protein
VLGIYLQEWLPNIPAQVFQVAPFPLMIFTLLIMSLGQRASIQQLAEKRKWAAQLLRIFSGLAPAALGRTYRPD